MSETPTETAPVLELPPPVGLTDLQQRGVTCCFCGTTLVAGNVVDPGPQLTDAFGIEVTWFPRWHPSHQAGAE